jgi:hypothetical protein
MTVVESLIPEQEAREMTGRAIVTYFVDSARKANDADPPRRVVGQLAKEVGTLQKEGHSSEMILTAIDIMVEKGLDASALSSCVFTAQTELRGISRFERHLLASFVEELRMVYGLSWPTGSRMVRGPGAATYVKDPLGVDRPTYSPPWGRPSRSEVVAALRERRGEQLPPSADSGSVESH